MWNALPPIGGITSSLIPIIVGHAAYHAVVAHKVNAAFKVFEQRHITRHLEISMLRTRVGIAPCRDEPIHRIAEKNRILDRSGETLDAERHVSDPYVGA